MDFSSPSIESNGALKALRRRTNRAKLDTFLYLGEEVLGYEDIVLDLAVKAQLSRPAVDGWTSEMSRRHSVPAVPRDAQGRRGPDAQVRAAELIAWLPVRREGKGGARTYETDLRSNRLAQRGGTNDSGRVLVAQRVRSPAHGLICQPAVSS